MVKNPPPQPTPVKKEEVAPVSVVSKPPSPIITEHTEQPQPTLQSYFDSLLDVTKTVPKYGALQKHGMFTCHTDKELTADLISYLDKSGWTISDLGRFMLKSYIYLEKEQVFTYFGKLQADKLLESDDIEDLKNIRDNLKRFIPGFLHKTAELARGFNKNDE